MKVGILGHFGVGENMLNGQTVKTKMLADGLKEYANIEIVKIDSHNWINKPFKLYTNIKKAFCECDIIVMLPAQNGVQIFAPLLLHFKKKYRKKVFYDVIGGWLPEFLNKKVGLTNRLRHFDGIWVETNTMKEKLESQGFENITVVPNFKELKPLSKDELVYPASTPYRLCTFSRVMREKGIGDAVEAVREVNDQLGYAAYSLDIYGQVDNRQVEWFENLKADFPPYVQYCGCVDSSKSVEVIKDYFVLLFPTYYDGEGFAGTLIDAYSAGVPVVATDWRYNAELVTDCVGFIYRTGNQLEFIELLKTIVINPKMVLDKKKACIEEAEKYNANTVIQLLINEF